jgi:hypothetical protein
MGKTYDSKCYDLSEHFLTGENIPPEREKEMLDLLAQDIQDATSVGNKRKIKCHMKLSHFWEIFL